MATTLQQGDNGAQVRELQGALNASGVSNAGGLLLDGDFGPATARAVRAYQTARGLSADGIAGPRTLGALGLGAGDYRRGRWFGAVRRAWEAHACDIQAGANDPPEGMPPIDPAAALAVLAVESNGRGTTDDDGSPRAVIRFEVHLFERGVSASPGAAASAAKYFRRDSGEAWKGHEWRKGTSGARAAWQTLHTGEQAYEYAALSLAVNIAAKAAYESISIGAAQILGSWHERLGYPTALAMLTAFDDEAAQVRGLFAFLRRGNDRHANPDGDLWLAAAERRWLDFARQYNGPGMPEWYAGHLAEAYREAAALIDETVAEVERG